MGESIQKAWDRTKNKLQTHLTRGADFTLWPKAGPNVYSVRVNDNVRAHLKRGSNWDTWAAINIGSHKELGHG